MSDDLTSCEEEPNTWLLKKSGVLLATLVEVSQDFPWAYCSITTTPDFEPYKQLFTFVAGPRRRDSGGIHAMKHREGIKLMTNSGGEVRAFTIAIGADQVQLTFTEV